MAVSIIRQDKAGKNEKWGLEVTEDSVTLTAPTGRVLLQWSAAEVDRGVEFPSFSKSIKYVGFNVAGQGMYCFDVDKGTLKQLGALANRGIASAGPGAVRSVLSKAILTSAGGLALTCFGAFALTLTVQELNGKESSGSRHPVGFISTLVGLAILCRGIYGFYQYSRLRKLARSPQENSNELLKR